MPTKTGSVAVLVRRRDEISDEESDGSSFFLATRQLTVNYSHNVRLNG